MNSAMAGLLNTGATGGPQSPIAAPSTLGETLADRLKRMAAEGQAAGVSRQGGNTGSFKDGLAASLPQRNTTGGVVHGYGSSGIPEEMAALEGNVRAAGEAANVGTVPGVEGGTAQPNYAPSMPAAPRAAGRGSSLAKMVRPQGDMLPPPGPTMAEQRVALGNINPNTRIDPLAPVPGYQPAQPEEPEAGLPAPPPAPPAPGEPPTPTLGKQLSAREEAEAATPKHSKARQGLAYAMTIAADALAGMQGRQTNYTQSTMGSRARAIDKKTLEIERERERLQRDLDRDIANKRADRAEAREEKELDGRLKKINADIEATKDENRIKELTLQARERKDQLNNEYKQAVLAQKRAEAERKGVKLDPGATYNVYNPATGEWVVAIENNNAMTTTTTERAQATDAAGKPGPSVEKSTTVTRAPQAKGGNGTESIPPNPDTVAQTRRKLFDLARTTGNLSQTQIDYLNATGGLEDK